MTDAEILRLQGANNQVCDPPVRIQGEIRRGEELQTESRIASTRAVREPDATAGK